MNTRKEPVTFGFDKPSDWLDKLRREIKSIEEISQGKKNDLVDHGINFSITAWHIADWAWAHFSDDVDVKQKIAKEIGCKYQDLTDKKFKLEICRPPFGLKSLDYCRIITTSAKHIGVEYDDPTFEVAVSAGPTTNLHRGQPVAFSKFEDLENWRLKIHTDAKNLSALEAYKEVLAYWDLFFRNYPVTS